MWPIINSIPLTAWNYSIQSGENISTRISTNEITWVYNRSCGLWPGLGLNLTDERDHSVSYRTGLWSKHRLTVLCLCGFLKLWKNNNVSRKTTFQRSDLLLNKKWDYQNILCYLENCVVREPCQQRTACNKGGFQLEFVSISWVINHMTSYNLSALIGWNYSIQTGEQIL